MRLIVFFDLPVGTRAQRKSYAQFRKYLLKSGWLMMQESVYVKLAINDRIAETVIGNLRHNRPPEGLVQVLKITERQYATIRLIVGGPHDTEEINDTEEFIVI